MSHYVFKLPDLGEGIVDSEIVKLYVNEGDMVEEDQLIVDMMTDKATVELTSPVAGRIVSLPAKLGDSIPVGAQLMVFAINESIKPDISNASTVITNSFEYDFQNSLQNKIQNNTTEKVQTSPTIRRKAREASIELNKVKGTGRNGRITQADLELHISTIRQLKEPAPKPAKPIAGGFQEIKVLGLRNAIAKKMQLSMRTIPHFSYIEEVDITELEKLRLHLNLNKQDTQQSLTYLPFLMLALAKSLPKYPMCNANFNEESNTVTQYDDIHIGVGTRTNDGLKCPVIKNVETLTIWNIAAQLKLVTSAARENRSKPEDLKGSTITVTSLGKLGGVATTPIINYPEVAIIGVNKSQERPVIIEGEIAIRRMMNLSASFDHRLIDGWDAANLMQSLKQLLEQPATLFIQ